ncbi:MAG: hypothetical protein AB8G99_01260 [Planctomycetaceae bacterium]
MTGRRGILTLVVLCIASGCTHFREDRAIIAFTDALAAGDLQQLKAVTSNEFEQKALRRSEALDDLQVLRLPEEPPAIVEVKDISDTEKEVSVTDAEGDSNLLYKLVQDEASGKWVVDDIFTKQQQAGLSVSKPITEQMDLLLTIRDFLQKWEEDDREQVLAITTSEFQADLKSLPAPWLARLTQQVVGNSQRNKSQRHHKPQVAINGKEAVVRLPRTDGTLQLSMLRVGNQWKVDDAAIQARREDSAIRSVRNRARVITASTDFVEAFRTGDRAKLKAVSTAKLFDSVLNESDLSAITIPDIMLAPTDYELKATVDHATMLIPTPQAVVRIELDQPSESLDDKQYRVSEIGLYDSSAESEMLLSAFFTATKQTTAFHDALLRSDRKALSRLSSHRFDDVVWSKAMGLPIQLLPVGATGTARMTIGRPEFKGSRTLVSVQHQKGESMFELINADGRLVVDDVQVGMPGKQRSLRRSLELAIPILAFATGVRENQIRDLQRVSSDDFNRLVWSRAKSVPRVSAPVLTQLTKPIRAMRTQTNRALVELGTKSSGATVSLVREHQHWVINDIEIINGLAPSQQVGLKDAMRTEMIAELKGLRSPNAQLASANLPQPNPQRKRFDLSMRQPAAESRADLVSPKPMKDPDIVQASATEVGGGSFVQHATFSRVEEEPAKPMRRGTSSTPLPASDPISEFADFADAQSITPSPGFVTPPTDAAPMPKPEPPPIAKNEVDLDALFADVEPESVAVVSTKQDIPTPKPQPAMAPEKPVASVVSAVETIVELNDTGRVTDPALQPIRIPMK